NGLGSWFQVLIQSRRSFFKAATLVLGAAAQPLVGQYCEPSFD
ncbi:MAG: hypothetical protein QOI26_2165, partial [Pseudonocardiales bacterium]|nr:hypothetical protein [Pseudonocardiales bacterium]